MMATSLALSWNAIRRAGRRAAAAMGQFLEYGARAFSDREEEAWSQERNWLTLSWSSDVGATPYSEQNELILFSRMARDADRSVSSSSEAGVAPKSVRLRIVNRTATGP